MIGLQATRPRNDIAQFCAISDDSHMDSLQLNLPARDAAPGKAPDIRPKVLRSWLAELPMAHATDAGQQLLGGLRGINRAFISAPERHAALELLHPTVQKLCATLQRSHRDASFPLPAGHCLMTTLNQQLLEEMANGYKQVITDRLLDDDTATNLEALTLAQVDRTLLSSLWRAVNYLGALLLECYLIYAPEPEGVWLDLHRLYRFAEQHLLHIYDVDALPDDPPVPSTLAESYKRIVLLSLCNPYHLMPDEAAILFQRFGTWSVAMKVVRLAQAAPPVGSFIVDLDADRPPIYAPPSKVVATPAQARLLDLGAPFTQLEDHINGLRAALKDKQVRRLPHLIERRDYELYLRLKRSWEMRGDRRFARSALPSNIVMVTGLSACHFYISGRAEFTPETDEIGLRDPDDDSAAAYSRPPPRAVPAAARSADEPGDADVWQQVYAHAPDQPPRRLPAVRENQRFSANKWLQRNASEGGMAVYCVNDCKANVRVGELIAYQRHGPAGDAWHLGVIRWLRAPDFASVELGIMMLADEAQAIATRAVRGSGAGGEYARSLLVRTHKREQQTLLAPPTIYDEGTILLVNLGNRLLSVKLTELIESTRTYAQFNYTPIGAV